MRDSHDNDNSSGAEARFVRRREITTMPGMRRRLDETQDAVEWECAGAMHRIADVGDGYRGRIPVAYHWLLRRPGYLFPGALHWRQA